jgi:16S rRNA (guanine966-N2)-methyltransferase
VRVISGTLKGRRLVAPAGRATRPTADRIKESIFNILAGGFTGKRVLDLFAGSGALGIEALSRGADRAVFVDQAKAALASIGRNIRDLGLEEQARVIQWNILGNLNCLLSPPETFDMVFMDPPYDTHAVSRALTALMACRTLAPGARIVIEHSTREPLTHPMPGLALSDQRRFGKTLVSFMDTVI